MKYLSALFWVFLLLCFAAIAEFPYSMTRTSEMYPDIEGMNILFIKELLIHLFLEPEHLLLFSTIILAAIFNELIHHKYDSPKSFLSRVGYKFKILFFNIIQPSRLLSGINKSLLSGSQYFGETYAKYCLPIPKIRREEDSPFFLLLVVVLEYLLMVLVNLFRITFTLIAVFGKVINISILYLIIMSYIIISLYYCQVKSGHNNCSMFFGNFKDEFGIYILILSIALAFNYRFNIIKNSSHIII